MPYRNKILTIAFVAVWSANLSAATVTRYLSDITWTDVTNGWGPVEKDMSNGETLPGDGKPISIGGIKYAKGLGAHAVSNIHYKVSGCMGLTTDVGVDDEVTGSASVIFQIWSDSLLLFDSGTMARGSKAKTATVDLTGKQDVWLYLTDAGNGNSFDHGDWANARFTCPVLGPTVTSTSPADGATGISASTSVTATFSTAMNPSTINSSTITVAPGLMTGVLTYAPNKATWTPAQPSMVVTIKGGPNGVKDTAGNSMDGDVTVTFNKAVVPLPPPPSPPPTGVIAISPGTDIQGVVNANPVNSKFLLRAGTHRMQSIQPKDSDTFTGEVGTILNGSKIITGWVKSGMYWVAGTGGANGNPSANPDWCESDYPMCMRTEDLFVGNAHFRQMDTLAGVGTSKYFIDYPASKVYLSDDPTGKTVEMAVTPQAFGGGAANVLISGLTIEKYANPQQTGAIHGVSGTGWTISSNTIQNNHGGGIKFGESATIIGNKILANGQAGILGSGSNDLIDSNEIAYNNTDHYNMYIEAGGTKFAFCNILTVTNNNSHDNNGPGLWTDINNNNVIYAGNTVTNNKNIGISHEISYKAVIRNNIIRGNGLTMPVGQQECWYAGGIVVGHSPDVEVYGNTLDNNMQGICAIQTSRGIGSLGPYEVHNLNVHDNTITQTNTWFAAAGLVAPGYDALYTSWNNHFTHNTYILGNQDRVGYNWGPNMNRTQWKAAGMDLTGIWP